MGVQRLLHALSLARNCKIAAIPCSWRPFNTFRLQGGVISIRLGALAEQFERRLIKSNTPLSNASHRTAITQ